MIQGYRDSLLEERTSGACKVRASQRNDPLHANRDNAVLTYHCGQHQRTNQGRRRALLETVSVVPPCDSITISLV